jgi:hypothetical protein
LGLVLGMSSAVYLVYNTTFVQHQGRYLFTALIPLALCFNAGLREAARGAAVALGLERRARLLEVGALAMFALALAMLAWVSLTRYVVPGLS